MATNTNNPEVVAAVTVRSVDGPQFVAEDLDDLFDMIGEEWSGEQCDNCGNSLYTIRFDDKFDPAHVAQFKVVSAFYVACTPDAAFWADAGEPMPEGVGCGTEYRLRWSHENEVAF